MSGATMALLTAPGSAAIAVVEVRGPRAYPLAKHLFTPAGKPLPDAPDVGRFWFGTLGRDEVVLSVADTEAVEVHCHGGPRVVRWVVEQFTSGGAEERTLLSSPRAPRLTCSGSLGWTRGAGEGFELLQHAPTLRTASILLDQLSGAFATEVRRILALLETDPPSATQPLHRLARLGDTVGRHLVEPWKVVVAGPPNVGKSSLVNALAGYQRAVVSDVAGTTRDAVGVRVAFDGWPVELIDTAGLRAADGLEAMGIEMAERVAADADLVVWVMDHADPLPVWPPDGVARHRLLTVVAKYDRPCAWTPDDWRNLCGATCVSAATRENLAALAGRIVDALVPDAPAPGAAVPFTPRLAELVEAANAANDPAEAARLLREALAASE